MRDPFPIPPIPALSRAVEPLAQKLAFPTLPLHIHEVAAGALLYTVVQVFFSPWLSTKLWPQHYPRHSRGKKVSWDAHVVSMVQSLLINALALWVMFVDDERWNMDREQRIWGYTGAAGMIQGLAAGYFVWDLVVTLLYIDVFGLGLLAHAASALVVYMFGFRPFLNFYGCTFILYELSTPFLNLHWFFDKLGMTGSRAQLYNGIALIVVFFSCRLVWGNIMSAYVYSDMWHAVWAGPTMPLSTATPANSSVAYGDPRAGVMLFAQDAQPVPVWLAVLYVLSNVTLNMLNLHWFFKMIKAVRKRFEPPRDAVPGTAEKAALKKAVNDEASPVASIATSLERTLEELRRRPLPEIEDDLAELQ